MTPKLILYFLGEYIFNQSWLMLTIFSFLFLYLTLISTKRPVAAVVLYFGVSITNPQITFQRLSEFPLAMIAAIICLISCIINARQLKFRMLSLYFPVYIFLLFSVFSYFCAINSDLAFKRFSEFNKISLIFILIVWAVEKRKDYDYLFYGLLVSFWYNVLRSMVQTQTHGAWYKISGTGGWIGDSNDWALALAMALPLFYVGMMRQTAFKYRLFHGLALLSGLLVMTFTSSRGGFLGIAAAVAVLLVTESNRHRALAAGVMIAVFLIVYMPASYTSQIKSIFKDEDLAQQYWSGANPETRSDQYSGAERVHNWRIAWAMAKDNPLTGVGWGNFLAIRQKYEDQPTDGTVAHSTWFQVAAESGLIALAAYVTMIGSAAVSLIRTLLIARKNNDLWASLHARGVLAGLIAFSISGSFVSRENSELLFLYIAMAAILTVIGRTGESPSTVVPSKTGITP